MIYLYGFVSLRTRGRILPGLCAAPDVFLIASEDVACAASVVDASDYDQPQFAQAAEQLAWLTPRAWRHHEVLQRLHGAGTVVPLKFGTLCEGIDQIHALLCKLRDPVRTLLTRFEGKDEWTLQTSVDRERLAAELQATHPELVAVTAEEHALPEGHAYFVRKRRERHASALLNSRLAALETAVYDRIADAAVEIGPPQEDVEGTALARAPLLVERSAFSDLEARLAALEMDHISSRLHFELSGPLPPYSFVPALDVMNPQVI